MNHGIAKQDYVRLLDGRTTRKVFFVLRSITLSGIPCLEIYHGVEKREINAHELVSVRRIGPRRLRKKTSFRLQLCCVSEPITTIVFDTEEDRRDWEAKINAIFFESLKSFAIFVARSTDRVPTSDGMAEATLEIWSRDIVVSSADRDRSPLHKISLRGIDGFSVVPGLRDTKEILIRFRTFPAGSVGELCFWSKHAHDVVLALEEALTHCKRTKDRSDSSAAVCPTTKPKRPSMRRFRRYNSESDLTVEEEESTSPQVMYHTIAPMSSHTPNQSATIKKAIPLPPLSKRVNRLTDDGNYAFIDEFGMRERTVQRGDYSYIDVLRMTHSCSPPPISMGNYPQLTRSFVTGSTVKRQEQRLPFPTPRPVDTLPHPNQEEDEEEEKKKHDYLELLDFCNDDDEEEEDDDEEEDDYEVPPGEESEDEDDYEVPPEESVEDEDYEDIVMESGQGDDATEPAYMNFAQDVPPVL